MTDWTGDDINAAVYTAFGERISGTQHRYGYAGAWGYQTHDDLPFLHVGHRYYDPTTGRFLQRDPSGILGGLNVYGFSPGEPEEGTDEEAQVPKKKKEGFWKKVGKIATRIWEVVRRLPPYILPSSPIPADVAPDAAKAYIEDAKRRHVLREHEDGLPDPNCPVCKRLTKKKRRKSATTCGDE